MRTQPTASFAPPTSPGQGVARTLVLVAYVPKGNASEQLQCLTQSKSPQDTPVARGELAVDLNGSSCACPAQNQFVLQPSLCHGGLLPAGILAPPPTLTATAGTQGNLNPPRSSYADLLDAVCANPTAAAQTVVSAMSAGAAS